MTKPGDPRQLAIDLLPRSQCQVKVAAVLADKTGIFAWGWNSVGRGLGEHAEAHAIRRANRRRLKGASIFVASERRRNGKIVLSRPCFDCYKRIIAAGIDNVFYRDADGSWKQE